MTLTLESIILMVSYSSSAFVVISIVLVIFSLLILFFSIGSHSPSIISRILKTSMIYIDYVLNLVFTD